MDAHSVLICTYIGKDNLPLFKHMLVADAAGTVLRGLNKQDNTVVRFENHPALRPFLGRHVQDVMGTANHCRAFANRFDHIDATLHLIRPPQDR